jgi:serine/threonine protein kinase
VLTGLHKALLLKDASILYNDFYAGRAGYRAPETLLNLKSDLESTHMWSLGMIMLEVLIPDL